MSKVPSSFREGSSASVTRLITDETVREFAALSGDTQPLHLDDEYASRTRFGQRIAHGALLVGMVSAVLGVKMADKGATIIFLGLTVNFVAPVHIGDEITANCEVVSVREDKPIVNLAVVCTNQRDAEVMTGEAAIYIDHHPV
ncbi:MAG: MaoC family dehydratase [Chloroflexi bacterium]|nr:MaoC family dehydratase [Chloroflexota bacterium]